MSLITRFGLSLDETNALLAGWNEASQATTDALDRLSAEVDVRRAALEESLRRLGEAGAATVEEAARHRDAGAASGQESEETAGRFVGALGDGRARCERQAESTAARSAELAVQAAGGRARLDEAEARGKAANAGASTARGEFAAGATADHALAGAALAGLGEALGRASADLRDAHAGARAGTAELTAGLDSGMRERIGPASDSAGAWLEGDVRGRVRNAVSLGLDDSVRGLAAYGGRVETLSQDVAESASALVRATGEVVAGIPGLVGQRGLNSVLETSQLLAMKWIADTISTTAVGVGVSTALVALFPVVKAISVVLNATVYAVEFADTGRLPSEDPAEDREFTEEEPPADGGVTVEEFQAADIDADAADPQLVEVEGGFTDEVARSGVMVEDAQGNLRPVEEAFPDYHSMTASVGGVPPSGGGGSLGRCSMCGQSQLLCDCIRMPDGSKRRRLPEERRPVRPTQPTGRTGAPTGGAPGVPGAGGSTGTGPGTGGRGGGRGGRGGGGHTGSSGSGVQAPTPETPGPGMESDRWTGTERPRNPPPAPPTSTGGRLDAFKKFLLDLGKKEDGFLDSKAIGEFAERMGGKVVKKVGQRVLGPASFGLDLLDAGLGYIMVYHAATGQWERIPTE